MKNEKGARSYKGEVIGDSMAITINFKWLLQIIAATAIVVYAFWKIEGWIQELEQGMVLAMEEMELHEQERKDAEAKHKLALEQEIKEQKIWIEKELGINLNPFSWGKAKRK